uniref:Protein CDV3 homolog n=1 Tax=Caenorhabditis tropicalis TaxID=1561998 RepID=A0A1I7TEX9_9PELO
MSDDLSAFFAKKKDKKKKAAVKIEEVGQALERRAKRQEEYEQEHEDIADKRVVGGVDEEKSTNPSEESEWIEYGESQGRLEGLKIKDMGLESEQDQVNNEEPEDREVHETKTWGQVSNEKKASEETEQAVTISDKAMAAAYKPPALRRGTGGGTYKPRGPAANLDMSSDAAFPSLADASKIEKVKKEESKSPGGWVKAGSGTGSSGPSSSGGPPRAYTTISGSGRESALAAAKIMLSSSSNPAPTRSELPPAQPAATAPAPTISATPKAGSYVPPHLRNK